MKLLPEDTFAALNRGQFIRPLEFGIKIPLEDQMDILSQIEPRFLNKYARIAKCTSKQLNEKVQDGMAMLRMCWRLRGHSGLPSCRY